MKPERTSKQTAEVGHIRRGAYREIGLNPEIVSVYVDEETGEGCIRVAVRTTQNGQCAIRTLEIDAQGGTASICA